MIAWTSPVLAGAWPEPSRPELRALITNGDLAAYWHHHPVQEHHRVHHARYRDAYDLTT
ncbi:hypothetical protein GCM10023334_076370 [Nonomuraea thailandensis]